MIRQALRVALMIPAASWALDIDVGPEIVVAEGRAIAAPYAALSGKTYLIAWTEGWPGATATDRIAGRRLRAGTLEALDPEPVLIANADGAQYTPSVAAAGDTFLVAWQDMRNERDLDIRAVRIDAGTGRRIGDAIDVAARPGNQARPATASDGTTFLVVWQEAGKNGAYGIRAARIALDGRLLDPEPIRCADKGSNPAAAGSGGTFLVTWSADKKTAARHIDPRTGVPGPLLGDKGVILSRCDRHTAIAHDGQGNFMVVSAREGHPNPWGWPGPGAVLCSRVMADGATPESDIDYGYRLNNVCSRKAPNVVDTATWGKADKWHAGSRGGFKGTRDGLWPRGWPSVAYDGKGGYLFAWVKGRIAATDVTELENYDVWLRGMDARTLAVTVPDTAIAADPHADEIRPRILAGPDNAFLVLYERMAPNQLRRIVARRIAMKP